MTNPRPSWEGLIAALKRPYIKCEELADKVSEEQGIPKAQDAAEAEGVSETPILATRKYCFPSDCEVSEPIRESFLLLTCY